MLEVRELGVRFGAFVAVDTLSFAVGTGEAVAVIGPNGAGKSTAVNAISGLVAPTSGSVVLNGVDITHAPAHRRAHVGMGRTFQNLELFGTMTVRDNVQISLEAHAPRKRLNATLLHPRGSRQANARVTEALERLELGRYADREVASLPMGIKKLTELARALVGQPDVLLLDEPAAGLSDEEKDHFVRLVKQWHEDDRKSLLLVEHDMRLVAEISDKVVAVDAGRLIAEGPYREVARHPLVVEAYLGKGTHAAPQVLAEQGLDELAPRPSDSPDLAPRRLS